MEYRICLASCCNLVGCVIALHGKYYRPVTVIGEMHCSDLIHAFELCLGGNLKQQRGLFQLYSTLFERFIFDDGCLAMY